MNHTTGSLGLESTPQPGVDTLGVDTLNTPRDTDPTLVVRWLLSHIDAPTVPLHFYRYNLWSLDPHINITVNLCCTMQQYQLRAMFVNRLKKQETNLLIFTVNFMIDIWAVLKQNVYPGNLGFGVIQVHILFLPQNVCTLSVL